MCVQTKLLDRGVLIQHKQKKDQKSKKVYFEKMLNMYTSMSNTECFIHCWLPWHLPTKQNCNVWMMNLIQVFKKKWYSFWMYNYDGLSDMFRSIRMKDINYWMQDWCIYRFQFHIKWIIKVSLHLVIRFCQLNGSPDDYLDQISHSYVTIS